MADASQEVHVPLSRNLFGKCDAEIKVRVPYELKQWTQTRAHELDTTESDYVRDLLFIQKEGLNHYISVMEARARAVAGALATPGTNEEQS